ncbi:hypothetical protein VYU27_002590 [Nannochloropsis oceanica]
MSGFEKMKTKDREPFNFYVVKQQNRALSAAVKQKERRIIELAQTLQAQERAQQANTALVSCVDRHWRQLEGDARMLLQVLGGGDCSTGENGSGSSEGGKEEAAAGVSTAFERVLLRGADKFLLADVTKLAEAAVVDHLDEVLKYDDESGEGWAMTPEENVVGVVGGQATATATTTAAAAAASERDKAAVAAVDMAVQQRCQLTRRVVQKLAQRLQEVAGGEGGRGAAAGPTAGASKDNQAQSGAADGQSPPGSDSSCSSSSSPLVEGTQRLQAQVELYRDRLAVAKRNQHNLYKGLIRALKDRHRYRRAEDWGMIAPLEEREGVMKMEEEEEGEGRGEGGREGRNGHHHHPQHGEGERCGGGHGEHKTGGQHKRKRPLMGQGGGGREEEEGGSVNAAELTATVEALQELRSLVEKRGEELERVREEKADLNRRLTALLGEQQQAAVSKEGGGGRGSVSEEQWKSHPLYRQMRIEQDGLRREAQEGERRIAVLRQEVGDLQGKMQMLAQSRQEAIDAERRHFVTRTDDLLRENQQLKRVVDEYSFEVEAKRALVRQADELKAALDDERTEAGRVRELSSYQAAELKEVRAQWAMLQDRLAGREEEVARLSTQVLSQVPPEEGEGRREGRIRDLEKQLVEAREEKERLAAFQMSLFEETESLTAAHEHLSGSMQRLKTQVEEKERRNNRLQDELMRTKATEQMQVERVMTLERKQHEFERLRLEQQTQIKEMQEVIYMLKTQSAALAQAKTEAEEEVSVEARKANLALRTTEEATLKLEGAQNKANALTRRAEDLGKELDTVEKARFSLQEQVSGLTGRLQRVQTKLEASSEGAGEGRGAAGAGPVVGAVGGGNAAQNETLLKLLNCSVCNVRWKDCVITKCYHLFCQQCIQSNLKVRSRKCPACGKHFSENDVKPIFLT